jgi:hypothetical protein
MSMKRIIGLMSTTVSSLQDAIMRAVPAYNGKHALPRWRNLGRSITPYHFMQPVPVPVQRKGRA